MRVCSLALTCELCEPPDTWYVLSVVSDGGDEVHEVHLCQCAQTVPGTQDRTQHSAHTCTHRSLHSAHTHTHRSIYSERSTQFRGSQYKRMRLYVQCGTRFTRLTCSDAIQM